MRKCPKRKVCPSHAVPAELLLMALRPNYRAKRKLPGIGTNEDPKLQANQCAWMYEEAYRKINQRGFTPLRWHRSWGAALQKNSKIGPAGKRVVHIMDVHGKAWLSKKMDKKVNEPWSTMDHGFLKGRRRESAIRVQQNAIYRYKRMRRSCIANNHDMANAFASVNHDLMEEKVVPALLSPCDLAYGTQRFR